MVIFTGMSSSLKESFRICMIAGYPSSNSKSARVTMQAESVQSLSSKESIVAQDLENFFNTLLIDLQV